MGDQRKSHSLGIYSSVFDQVGLCHRDHTKLFKQYHHNTHNNGFDISLFAASNDIKYPGFLNCIMKALTNEHGERSYAAFALSVWYCCTLRKKNIGSDNISLL